MLKIFHLCLPQIKDKLKFARHIKIALFVGTILNIINQLDYLVDFNYHKLNGIKIAITYIVPFLVSVYSGASFNNERDK